MSLPISVNEAVNVYSERLKPNKMMDNLKETETTVNDLCALRLKLTKLNKTEPWTMDDLSQALKQLGNGKSKDPLGNPNEIFKDGVAGSDLKLAVLRLMNLIKKRQQYPHELEACNITSLYKNKNSKKEFDSYRGVFRVTVFREILDRLMYNSDYRDIDTKITDGNFGGRAT